MTADAAAGPLGTVLRTAALARVGEAVRSSETVRVSARHRLIAIRPDGGFDVRIGQVTARGDNAVN